MEIISLSIANKFKLILCKLPIIESYQNDFLEIDEFKRLIATFDINNQMGLLFKILFLMLFYGGMRIGEALALKYTDINYKSNVITITKQAQIKYGVNVNNKYEAYGSSVILPYTKTNSTKHIEIPKWLTEYIKNYKLSYNKDNNDYIFVTSDNKTILTRNYIKRTLDRHLKMANLRHIRVHDFRHSSVTLLYDLGADSKFVSERMGHSSEATSLKIYNHMTEKRRAKNNKIIKNLEKI